MGNCNCIEVCIKIKKDKNVKSEKQPVLDNKQVGQNINNFNQRRISQIAKVELEKSFENNLMINSHQSLHMFINNNLQNKQSRKNSLDTTNVKYKQEPLQLSEYNLNSPKQDSLNEIVFDLDKTKSKQNTQQEIIVSSMSDIFSSQKKIGTEVFGSQISEFSLNEQKEDQLQQQENFSLQYRSNSHKEKVLENPVLINLENTQQKNQELEFNNKNQIQKKILNNNKKYQRQNYQQFEDVDDYSTEAGSCGQTNSDIDVQLNVKNNNTTKELPYQDDFILNGPQQIKEQQQYVKKFRQQQYVRSSKKHNTNIVDLSNNLDHKRRQSLQDDSSNIIKQQRQKNRKYNKNWNFVENYQFP